ncbi:MAG: hypothetical protein V1918_06670 [Planctomycetota bacterium]
MECETAARIALLRESGEASSEEAASLEEHLSACARCREEAEVFREILSQYRSFRTQAPPPAAVRVELLAHRPPSRAGTKKILRLASTALATAAVLLIAFAAILGPRTLPLLPAFPEEEFQRLIGPGDPSDDILALVKADLEAADESLGSLETVRLAPEEIFRRLDLPLELIDAFADELEELKLQESPDPWESLG